DPREFLDDFQADRPLSGDRGRMRERVDESGGPRPPSLVLVGVDQVPAGDRGDVRSLGSDRLDLATDGPFRDADRAGQAEPEGRPGAGQAMVSGTDRADAPYPVCFRQVRDPVPHAADLERRESLEVLEVPSHWFVAAC